MSELSKKYHSIKNVHCCMLWLSRLTARSAFSLSMNLTLQTLDAMCQNTNVLMVNGVHLTVDYGCTDEQ